jgi:hypothetical protein
MPIAVPTITEIVPASYEDCYDLIDALTAHFGSVSTQWNLVNVTGGASIALVIESVADPGFQIAFYTEGPTLNVSIHTDFVNGITAINAGVWTSDANDISPVGVFTYEGINTHAIRAIHLVELDDAIFLMCVHQDNYWLNSIHAGRIYRPDFPDADVPLGRDGLGYLLNRPTVGSNGNVEWWPMMGNAGAALRSCLRRSTGNWAATFLQTSVFTSSAGNADNASYMGFVRPYAARAAALTVTYGNVSIGSFKYLANIGTNFAALTRVDLDNGTDQSWISLLTSTAGCVAMIWRRGYVP